jgi:hypothetical protein
MRTVRGGVWCGNASEMTAGKSGNSMTVGSISKCGDRRVRMLLYEAANVILTHYKGQLKLKDWALAIARRSTMGKARIALASCTASCVMGRSSRRLRPSTPHRAAARSDAEERKISGPGLCLVGVPITRRGGRNPALPGKARA